MMNRKPFLNNNNNPYRNNNKNPKKMNNPQNYQNFNKPMNMNSFPNSYKINQTPYNNMSTTNNNNYSADNFQNQFGRNAFFQNFWKSYSKSYEYEYFATSSDLTKQITEYYNEINAIVPETSKKSEDSVIINKNPHKSSESENETPKNETFTFTNNITKPSNFPKKVKVGGIFKPRKLKSASKSDNQEKKDAESKVRAVFQNYNIFAEQTQNEETKEVNDY